MIRIAVACGLWLAPVWSWAAIEGEWTEDNFVTSVCNVGSMSVDATVAEAFGEPIVAGRVTWRAGPNTAADCLAPGTLIYLRIGAPSEPGRYVRLSPEIRPSEGGYGRRVNVSPSWDRLFCDAAGVDAQCLPEVEARALLSSAPPISGFVVVTQALAARRRSPPVGASSAKTSVSDSLDLDARLARTIGGISPDEAREPAGLRGSSPGAFAASPEEAVRNVVTLLTSALAQYVTPPRECESSRRVANWVQARGRCRLTFRTERSHAFTCTDDGRPAQVVVSANADVDFTNDVSDVSEPRVSPDGWVALVLTLTGPIGVTGEDGYKVDRWQFTASADRLGEVRSLAGNLRALQQLCGVDS